MTDGLPQPTTPINAIGSNVITPTDNTEEAHEQGDPPSIGSTTTSGYAPTPPPSTTDAIDAAIESISAFEFNAERDKAESELAAAAMMFGGQSAIEPLPATLETEEWAYSALETPNPITIGTASKFLAAAYAKINCDLDEAGVHGYAWIIEPEEVWLKRPGITEVIPPPSKPTKGRHLDMQGRLDYMDDLQAFNRYNTLVQRGTAKLVEWFGKAMFLDLHVDGMLPATTTPKELIKHLTKTYAQPRDHRRHMEMVQKEFEKGYNPQLPVESYFMRLQDVARQAELLGRPYTEPQLMDKALGEFEKHYEKEAGKAEKKWGEKKLEDKTWKEFKEFWKSEIHEWNTFAKPSKKRAHLAETEMETILERLDALQAENRTIQSVNNDLAQQLQFQRAFQVERRSNAPDDVSTITEYLSGLENRLQNQIAASIQSSHSTSRGTSNESKQGLLQAAKARNPMDYKNINDGKGKRFNSYCWKCGCNCTHWTRRCYELTDAERKRYRDASFQDTMGGSTKFLDRRGSYQSEYGFDSL